MTGKADVVRFDFVGFLREVGRGKTLHDLAERMEELVAAVKATKKAGSLTFKINVEPVEKDEVHTVTVADAIKLSLPEPDRPGTFFFPTSDNRLQRKDPRQLELDELATETEKQGHR